MRILCSNDDGIHASGLKSLEKIARELSDDVWVVAPQEEQSGAARALTLAHPIRVRKYDDKRFAVSGTPTDAVMMAVTRLMQDKKPDLVLSGVNNGQNIAEDVTFSGTIAAAFQGMTLGVPSIALSLSPILTRERAMGDAGSPWRDHHQTAARGRLAGRRGRQCEFSRPRPGRHHRRRNHRAGPTADAFQLYVDEREDLRGGTYYWFGFTGKLSDPPAGTDLKAIYEGRISITPLHLALTHEDTRKRFASADVAASLDAGISKS